jgi:hypothetical protein
MTYSITNGDGETRQRKIPSQGSILAVLPALLMHWVRPPRRTRQRNHLPPVNNAPD